MEIVLQYFDGCPNWQTTDARLRAVMEELEVSAPLQHVVIGDAATAEALGFHGSPTVVIDGVDPFAEPDAPVGLACRIYSTEDGPAGSPTHRQLRRAIEEAAHAS